MCACVLNLIAGAAFEDLFSQYQAGMCKTFYILTKEFAVCFRRPNATSSSPIVIDEAQGESIPGTPGADSLSPQRARRRKQFLERKNRQRKGGGSKSKCEVTLSRSAAAQRKALASNGIEFEIFSGAHDDSTWAPYESEEQVRVSTSSGLNLTRCVLH